MKPLLAVLAVAAAGLVLVLFDKWRVGAAVIGLALSLAGALRLGVPRDKAGDLAVRSRLGDAILLIVLGFAVVGLANSIPGR